MQLELPLLTSISNSINESAAIGLDNDEDLAFECGHGVEPSKHYYINVIQMQ